MTCSPKDSLWQFSEGAVRNTISFPSFVPSPTSRKIYRLLVILILINECSNSVGILPSQPRSPCGQSSHLLYLVALSWGHCGPYSSFRASSWEVEQSGELHSQFGLLTHAPFYPQPLEPGSISNTKCMVLGLEQ